LELFSWCLDIEQLTCYATVIRAWGIEIIDAEGEVHFFKGSPCGVVTIGVVDLALYSSQQIPAHNLFILR
jgi:hypothetical protein